MEESFGKKMPTLKEDTLRVVRMDPYFYPAYLFSAGILTWFRNVGRPGEALEILEEGIRNNPTYWTFRTYAGAILYTQKKDFSRTAYLLEDAVRQENCPALVKAILANIHKSLNNYPRALEIWQSILDDPSAADYHLRARHQIREIERRLRGY